ncbi:ComEC/Rec2 family competence protein [Sinomonas mesophila]|uniref:ComEC/Rec2 family competence protein n=1 Tax=Sinomonas mesophila TaxID=1531955 RepID=UPI0009877D8F|nr:ComEC/Rec2 family competence protein [Sinomonas mesophila]
MAERGSLTGGTGYERDSARDGRGRAWERYRSSAASGVAVGEAPRPRLRDRAKEWIAGLWSNADAPSAVWGGRWRDLRLAPLGAAAWLGAALGAPLAALLGTGLGTGPAAGAGLAGTAALASILAGLALVGAAAVRMRRRRAGLRRGSRPGARPSARQKAAVLGGCIAVALGAGLTASAAQWGTENSGPTGELLSRGGQTTATVEVTDDARAQRLGGALASGPRFLAEARLLEATYGGRAFSSRARVLLAGGPELEGLRAGVRLELAGTVVPAEQPAGRALLSLDSPPRTVGSADGARAAASAREALRGASSWLPADAAGLLPGMAVGDTSALPADLEEAMRAVGLGHLTAVSGANFTIVLGAVLLTMRSLRAPRWLAVGASAAALGGYLAVVGPEPSVARAAVMGTVGLAALTAGRPGRSCSALAAAVLVMVVVDPSLAASLGFVLSVTATLGIALVGPPLAQALAHRLPGWLALSAAVPLSAQLLCGPIVVLIQPQFLTLSLAANVAVAPLVPLVTLAGTLALATGVWCPPAAVACAALGGAAAQGVAAVARAAASVPGAALPWPDGAPGALAMAGMSAVNLAALWAVFVPSGRAASAVVLHAAADALRGALSPGESGTGPVGARETGRAVLARRRLAGAAGALVVVAALLAGVRLVAGPRGLEGWHVTLCDVGQGDAVVLATGERAALVVDSGPDPRLIDSCLDDLGIGTVEAYVITHFHADHYGGTAGVLSGRTVRRALVPAAAGAPPAVVRDLLAAAHVPVAAAGAGEKGRAGPLSWRVLWPARPAGAVAARAESIEQNNVSLVLDVDWDGMPQAGILLTGDLEEDAAARLLAREPGLARRPPPVLKIAHHGARNGGTAILDALRPDVALISAGRDNDYGHPHPEIVAALEHRGTATVRTDESGTVQLRFASGSVQWAPR